MLTPIISYLTNHILSLDPKRLTIISIIGKEVQIAAKGDQTWMMIVMIRKDTVTITHHLPTLPKSVIKLSMPDALDKITAMVIAELERRN